MNSYLSLRCSGGKNRSNGYFGYLQNSKFEIGSRHVSMSKVGRIRASNLRMAKYREVGDIRYARISYY